MLVVVLILGSFILRLWRLDAQSLWFDEGWSWHLAAPRMSLGEMAVTTAGDRSPPLYYALLHVWIALAGQSEFAMRFISVVADTATVALVIAMTQALTRSRASLIAGAIYAVSPFAVWYAQETRMYAPIAALCTASSYFLWKWLDDARCKNQESRTKSQDARPVCISRLSSSASDLIASAVLLTLAIYCHYYAIFLLPAHFFVVLIASLRRHNSQFTKWLVAAACVIASLTPWLLIASTGFAYDDGFTFPLNTIDGRTLEWVRGFASGGLARPLPDVWPWLISITALLGVISFAANKRWRELLVVLVLIAVPLLAATVAVRVVYPYRSVFHPRYLIYVAPMVCVLLGSQKLEVRSKKLQAFSRFSLFTSSFLLAVLWLPTLYAYFTDPSLARDDTRGAVKHVVEAVELGDIVVMSRDNFAVRYYWPEVKADFLLAAPDGLHGVLNSDEDVIAKLNAAQPMRVRLMLWQDDVVDPQKFVESTLWANGYEIGEFNFAQIRLPLYQVEQLPIARPPFKAANVTFGDPDGDGDQLALKQYWQRERGIAGDWFYVVLEWEAHRPMSKDYKVFVHVLDQNDQLAFQNDKLPLNPLLPMTRWQPDQTMRDAHAMVIPADLAAGTYRVVVGVYDPANQRLPARDQSGDLGTFAPLGTLAVIRR